jgi:S-DNA-T family DNA segregation ATPase FtsK/SpoIIIE
MERRLRLLAQAGNRNIENFNKRVAELHANGIDPKKITEEGSGLEENDGDVFTENEPKPILNSRGQLPYIVILIDELADLMLIAGKEVEESITRLAQMARAVGIHLILATQRPSVDVITGLIKANFPARISFKVSSRVDSRTILDSMGSENLLGDGDMLYMKAGTSNLQRIHGSFVTEAEVEKLVDFLKKQGSPQYQESILLEAQEDSEKKELEEEADELFDQAVEVVANSGQASVSYIQRRLRIGYNRAARIVECMETKGLIGPADGYKPREIYISNFGYDR